MATGFSDSGSNETLPWAFKEQKKKQNLGPYLRSLNISFAAGSFIGPLVVGKVMESHSGDFDAGCYIIAGIFIVPVVGLFFQNSPTSEATLSTSTYYTKKQSPYHEWFITGVTMLFLGACVGAETTMGLFIFTYSTRTNLANLRDGYILSFLFWFMLCLGRVFAIPLSGLLDPMLLLAGNVACSLLFSVLVILMPDHVTLLWACVALFGLFMSSNFCTITDVTQTLMTISGNIPVFFVIGAGVGSSIVPLITSKLFTSSSFLSLFYVNTVCCVIMALSVGCLFWVRRGMGVYKGSALVVGEEMWEDEVLSEENGGTGEQTALVFKEK